MPKDSKKEEKMYMFAVTLFGKERRPVCEYGRSEDEARIASKKHLIRGERLGDLLEIDGCMVR